MTLPEHITRVSEKWYFDTNKQKYVHSDRIEGYCEKVNKVRATKKEAKNASIKYKRNIKAAFRRWEND